MPRLEDAGRSQDTARSPPRGRSQTWRALSGASWTSRRPQAGTLLAHRLAGLFV